MEVEQGNRIKHLDDDQSNCELDNLKFITDEYEEKNMRKILEYKKKSLRDFFKLSSSSNTYENQYIGRYTMS